MICRNKNEDYTNINKHGFGLIEALTAVAVTGIVLVAGSQVANYVNSQVQKTVTINERRDLLNEIRDKITFANRCSTSIGWENPNGPVRLPWPPVLNTTDWTTTTGHEIRLYIPGIQSGANVQGSTISNRAPDNILPLLAAKIYSLRLQEAYPVPIPPGGLPSGETQYIAKLVIQVGPISASSSNVQISPPVVLTTLTFDVANGPTGVDPNAVAGDIIDCPPNGVTQSPSVVCQNFGCTYHADGSCTCPTYLGGCSDPYKIIVGVDQSGILDCQYPANGSCGPNTYLSGITPNWGPPNNPPGKLACTRYVDGSTFTGTSSAMCPQNSDWTWSSGATNCSATYSVPSNVAIGTTISVTDSNHGTASFICANSGWQLAISPAPTCM